MEGEGVIALTAVSQKYRNIVVLLLEDPIGIAGFQVRDLEQRF